MLGERPARNSGEAAAAPSHEPPLEEDEFPF